MKRSSFLKKLGFGLAGVVVGGKVLADSKDAVARSESDKEVQKLLYSFPPRDKLFPLQFKSDYTITNCPG